jgi:hypothetical protein
MSAARQAHELIHRYLIDEAQASDVAELERLLLHDAEVADAFVDAAWFDALLQAAHAPKGQLSGIGLLAAEEDSGIDFAAQAHLRAKTPHNPSPVPVRPAADVSLPSGCPGIALADQDGFGAGSYSFSGWPVAYLVATVIFGIGLVVGALVHVSQPVQHVQSTPTFTTPSARNSSIVGRITATVDCVFDNDQCRMLNAELQAQKTDIHHSSFITQHSLVHLGDKFTLSSGLMEISYDTGAKVILQGPVSYEVESRDGGYLSVGKLTAKLEQKSEVRGQRSESANQKSEIINPKFAVRTPTAIVTDLGTEFGVEVDNQGATTSHVFRGSVRVQATSNDGRVEGEARVLHENESARVVDSGRQGGGNPAITTAPSAKPPALVREIPRQGSKPVIKTFDLVDVVAGGDGFSGRRDRGIDPTNGRIATELSHPPEGSNPMSGDGEYHRVSGMPLVDGVFIPHDRKKPVQVDSAGHAFADFGVKENATWQHIWAGGVMRQPIYPTKVGDIDYAVKPHGLLLLHANAAVTFDLEAIRRASPGCTLSRFRAIVANVEQYSQNGPAVSADLRVLVDGQSRFQRREISGYSGAIPASVPLSASDRFLTLVATDGGNGISGDLGFFGDPRLELLRTEMNERSDSAGTATPASDK